MGHSEKPPSPSFPASEGSVPRSPITTTHLFTDNYFSSWATIKPSPYGDRPSSKPAAAGPGRSEHRNVDILIPLARQRESPAGPNVPCERRTDPAEPHRGTDPQRQPNHSATAKQVRAPGGMRRSFRTLRLCAIPGVSPRAGLRCPGGALRTPQCDPAEPHHHNTPVQR